MLPPRSNFSEWYSAVLKEADLVDLRYGVKGFLVIKPWAFKVIKAIYALYEKELERDDHAPVHFPAVIPESYFAKEKEHIKGFEGEVFWITHAGHNKLEERLVLRPTSETAFYPMYALWIQGWRDLPLKLYQSGTVWRYETKATRPFLRVREILWIEAHDAFATHEEALAQVERDMAMAERVIRAKLGIPFLALRRPQWDKFAGAENTFAADTIMPDGRALQIATTHDLGQHFAKAFSITFKDSSGRESHVWQTCYGPGISRIYAALVALHGDEKGLIYPYAVSPIKVVVVPIPRKGKEGVVEAYAGKVAERLEALGIPFFVDTTDRTPGNKFFYWELKGVPFRIEVGPREAEEGTVVLASRLGGKETIPLEELSTLPERGRAFDAQLRERAEAFFTSHLFEASSWEELEEKVGRGMVKVPFCSIDMDGVECYHRIKEELKAEVRGEELRGEKPGGERCVVCGKEAKHFVWVAKQY